jgi:undecaprenyl-diphosphatase
VNYQLFQLINGAAGRADGVDDVMEFAATWLIYPIFVMAAGLVAAALRHRRVRPVFKLGVALVLAFTGATVLSHLNGEVRPFQSHPVHQLIPHDPGIALPSDHATAAFAVALGVYAFLSRRWGIALGVAALAVGFSRVWSGVHYPGDIAAAAIIAGLAVLSVVIGTRGLRTREQVA